MNPPTTTTIAYVKGFGCDVRHKTRALLRELRASLRDGGAAGGSPPYTPNRLSKLTLDSCLSKGRRTASFERCRSQADRAKTPRHFQPCPIFAAYDRAEEKKSRKSALRTTVRSFPSSFRTVCKVFGTARWDHGVRLAPSDLLGLIERTARRANAERFPDSAQLSIQATFLFRVDCRSFITPSGSDPIIMR